MIKLSILICTTKSRGRVMQGLLDNILNQIGFNRKLYCPEVSINDDTYTFLSNGVELIINSHETDNVGKKRNCLLKLAKGEYVVAVDSDDEISTNYVSLILKAIETKPDCVAINGTITTNGKDERKWFISKEYGRWYTGRDGNYYRTPNHISPVRRELALQAGFPEISHGEDFAYSMKLLPLLKKETIIEEPIYHYKYVTNK